MLDDLLEKGIIQLSKPKRPEKLGGQLKQIAIGMIGWSVTPLKYMSHLRSTTGIAKDGRIILDFNDVVETNHISYQTKGLFII